MTTSTDANTPTGVSAGLPAERLAVRGWLAVCLLFVALNLRSVIAGVSPVLPEIRAELGMSEGVAGAALTLTLVCFGLGAFAVPPLLRRLRPEALLAIAAVVLFAGAVGRALLPGTVAFFVGTAVVGCGIAVGNVVVPLLIRTVFARRVAVMTGWYAVMLDGGAVLASGLTRPFIDLDPAWTWRTGQLPWAGLVAAALVAWVVVLLIVGPLSPAAGRTRSARGGSLGAVVRLPVAWAITAVMGLQSVGFYAVLSWGPTVLHTTGIDLTTGGWLMALLNAVAVPASLVAPSVLRGRRRLPGLVILGVGYLVGLALLPLGLVPATVAALLLGLAQGSAIAYALALIASALPVHRTAALSAMAQGLGYLLAGIGPWLFGVLSALDPTWWLSISFVALAVIGFVVAAVAAERQAGSATSATEGGHD